MIIPILNRFDLLEKALGSINHPIDEILIINNSGEEEIIQIPYNLNNVLIKEIINKIIYNILTLHKLIINSIMIYFYFFFNSKYWCFCI